MVFGDNLVFLEFIGMLGFSSGLFLIFEMVIL